MCGQTHRQSQEAKSCPLGSLNHMRHFSRFFAVFFILPGSVWVLIWHISDPSQQSTSLWPSWIPVKRPVSILTLLLDLQGAFLCMYSQEGLLDFEMTNRWSLSFIWEGLCFLCLLQIWNILIQGDKPPTATSLGPIYSLTLIQAFYLLDFLRFIGQR